MTVETTEYRRNPAGFLARGTALAVVLTLAGCSYVPDYANPVNWYDSIAGDDAPAPEQDDSALAQPVPGSDQNFPTLASVPARPDAPTPSAERQRVQQGLVADRDNAKYTEQVANTALQQQAANTAPPPPRPAPPPAAASTPAPATDTTTDSGSRPPTLTAAPPPPPPPAATTVARADVEPPKPMAPPPPPPMPAASDASDAAPPSTADLTNLPGGRRRMAVPQIVQRGPAPAPIQSGSVSRAPAVAATTPPQVPSAATVPPASPPPAPVATTAPALPSQVRAATPPPTPTPAPVATAATPRPSTPAPIPAAPAPRVAMQPAAPASSAVAQRLNLPVAPDQQALNEAFSRNIAAQQGMTLAALPVGDPAPGGAVIDSGGTVYVGGSPGRPNYTTTRPGPAPSGLGAAPAGLVATVHFGHGGAGLSAQAQRDIRAVAAEAKRTGRTVRVVGHSSQRTGNMPFERHLIANFNISLDRANRVAQALARAGVDGSRIVVEAVGDTQPLYFEFMPNGEAENRRAEIFLE
ncbi:MAG: OmpA family protein [Alphaproteobacteria bacterium]